MHLVPSREMQKPLEYHAILSARSAYLELLGWAIWPGSWTVWSRPGTDLPRPGSMWPKFLQCVAQIFAICGPHLGPPDPNFELSGLDLRLSGSELVPSGPDLRMLGTDLGLLGPYIGLSDLEL